MTISSSVRLAGPYPGNDSATDFPFGFKVFRKNDVQVTLTDVDGIESVLTLDSDYSVSLNADQENSPGGSVTYPISGLPLATGLKLTLSGKLPYDQPADITNQGGFYPQVIENALDRVVIQTQQLQEQISRAVKVKISSQLDPDQLIADLTADAASARNAATAAGQSADAASDSAQAALLSEQNALASEQAAALSESNALQSKNDAADSAAAALLSEQNALASEQAAALSEGNASTSEQNAANSATAALLSEQNASTSEQNALDSANAAALSESNAAASENAARTYLEAMVQPFAFMKADYDTPCLIKTGAQTVSVKAGTIVVVNGVARSFTVDTAVTMPGTLTAGEDYSVWVKPDNTAVAVVDSFLAPATAPVAGAVKIGGFHYGLVAAGETVAGGSFSTSGVTSSGGSFAWTQADVDKIAGINAFSIWDLALRKKGEQYGFAYDPQSDTWGAIYFCGTAPHLNGISRYNTDVCSGTVLPFVPPEFGGDGTLKYAAFRSWEANELCLAHGSRLFRYEEFCSAAFGVTEGQSLGGSAVTIPATARQPGYTSRIGLEQATGHVWIIGGPMISVNGTAYATNGRGSWYGTTGLALFGGARSYASDSGSRAASFGIALSGSFWYIGLRAAGDPQKTIGPALYTEGL